MIRPKGYYKYAATFCLISAILHFGALMIGGITVTIFSHVVGAILLTLIAIGLNLELRFAAYLAFIFALIGAIAAMSSAMTTSGITANLFWMIVVSDLIVFVLIFAKLWRDRPIPLN